MRKKTNHYYYNAKSTLQFKITEAYKTIRTNIVFSFTKKGCRKICITSSCPAEGKSTMAVNIAVAMAQTNVKVLLLDCDLRRPKVHRFLGINNTPGLTNYLSTMTSPENIVRETQFPNLHVITSGSIVPNPSEVLTSVAFHDFLKAQESKYDYIIIDTTPVNVVADALPLIKQSDGTIVVVREKHSTYNELDSALENLERIEAKIIGFIYNGGSTSSRKYSYRYRYYYSKND